MRSGVRRRRSWQLTVTQQLNGLLVPLKPLPRCMTGEPVFHGALAATHGSWPAAATAAAGSAASRGATPLPACCLPSLVFKRHNARRIRSPRLAQSWVCDVWPRVCQTLNDS